jgi:prepilin-type N-terminal cleavage/methylation domain-containing protein
MSYMKWAALQKGFTIVELLVVIVIISILAVITIVGFNSIQKQATEAGISSDLQNSTQQLEKDKIISGSDQYEPSLITKHLSNTGAHSTVDFIYGTKSSYCFQATSPKRPGVVHHVDSSNGVSSVLSGSCPTPSGSAKTRCISGQVIITVTQLNTVGQVVTMNLSAQTNEATLTVNPGSSGSSAFNTRNNATSKGFATVIINGTSPSTYNDIRYYAYPDFSC